MNLLGYIKLKFANYADPFRYRNISGKPLTRWQRFVCWVYVKFWKITAVSYIQIPEDVQKAIRDLQWYDTSIKKGADDSNLH